MKTAAVREILRKVRQIEVRTRRMADSSLAGSYHSVFKGRGMNFDEVREYVPGDEIRTIDWNVTARTGVAHVKKFTEERELTIMLLIDLSASGGFGSGRQSKREMMAELAAALAFSAVRNSDKVGLLLFSDFAELFIAPDKGRSHILRVIRELLFFQPQGKGTDIGEALHFFSQVAKRKCVTFLISDFCLPGDFDDSLQELRPKLQAAARRHDLIAVSVTDPRELELPDAGWITLEDAETGEQVLLNSSDEKTRLAYANLTSGQRERFARALRGMGIDLLQLSAGTPYLAALMGFFRARSRRMSR
ncbi:DUF58 domain-containing protein [Candidatus Electronema sp. TJ]|uniref:DUF58 domain-containing protein n=1 Tax=Candidatus Electronema sp. TJ TaxID=3401573 RepID=UPI003AA7E9A1